jgi:hypothetical protein
MPKGTGGSEKKQEYSAHRLGLGSFQAVTVQVVTKLKQDRKKESGAQILVLERQGEVTTWRYVYTSCNRTPVSIILELSNPPRHHPSHTHAHGIECCWQG